MAPSYPAAAAASRGLASRPDASSAGRIRGRVRGSEQPVQAGHQRIAGLVQRVAAVDQVPVDGLDLCQRVGCGQYRVGLAAEGRELGREMAGELDAEQPPASVEALPDNVAGR